MNKTNKFIYWTPRALSIFFILFLMLFSLDIFDLNLNFWQTILGLLVHNIPAFILIIILVISWKKEAVGGIIFTLFGAFFLGRMLMTILSHPPYEWRILLGISPIILPAILIGVLFLIGWQKKIK
ncbi:MAG TPA: hypothetical protein PKY08_00175 [Candidatus Magasanikbacteria bacterium]|nr:hypothetical protein [Candidatus Magasanikbacteria bacterium]